MTPEQMQAAMNAPQQDSQTAPGASNQMTPQQMQKIMGIGGNLTPDQSAATLGHANNALLSYIKSIPSTIQQAAQGGVEQIQQGFQQEEQAKNPVQLLEAGATGAAGAVDVASSPLAPAMSPISKAVDYTADKISDIPAVQKFAGSPAGDVTSRIAQDVQNLDTIAGGVSVLAGGGPLAKEGLQSGGESLVKSGEASQAIDRESFIRNLVTPEQTVKTATQEIKSGRVQEGGVLFKGREIAPTKQSQSVTDTVNSIPGVKAGNTLLKNVNVIHDAIGKTAQELRTQLDNSNIIFPKQEVISFIGKAKDALSENPMITGDAEKTAAKMLDKFQQILSSKPATPSSLLDARQEFDSWVKSQKGESVFDPAKDSAISVALKTIRQGANDFLADKVQDVPVKKLLSQQTDMFNAIDSIAPKAAKEAETKVGRLVQKAGNVVGVKNKIVQDIGAAVGLAGFGAAAYFAPSAAALMGMGGLGYGIYKGITSPALRIGAGKTMQAASNIIPK